MLGVNSLILISLLTWKTSETYPQMTASCAETESVPDGFLHHQSATPSILRAIRASLIETEDPLTGQLELNLNVSWAISIDQSNEVLTGTRINIDDKSFRCVYHPPLKTVNTSGYEEIWFHFTNFTAEPDTSYSISGCNLPYAVIGAGSPLKMCDFQTDGCKTEKMKYHHSCVKKGSLWEPRITAVFLKDEVQINFTSSQYSDLYLIELWNKDIINRKELHTAGEESGWTESLNSTDPCEFLSVTIQPHFAGCGNICDGIRTKVDCTKTEPTGLEMLSTSVWIGVCCIIMALLLLTACVFSLGKASYAQTQIPKMPKNAPPTSVLILYPAKNNAFQRAVVSLAELLKSCCHCSVVIDVWQRGRVAELGLLRWLMEQTDSAKKVMFVIGQEDSTPQARPSSSVTDFMVPASVEDVFSLALNILAGHAQDPVRCSKYFAVHLGEDFDQKSLPEALKVCRSFCLMRDLGKLCRNIHGMPSRPNFNFLSNKSGLVSSRDLGTTLKLRDAIKELQMWQEGQSGRTNECAQLVTAL